MTHMPVDLKPFTERRTRKHGEQFLHEIPGEKWAEVIPVCAWCGEVTTKHPTGNYYRTHAPAECLGTLQKKLRIRTLQAIRCAAGFHKWFNFGHPEMGFARSCHWCNIETPLSAPMNFPGADGVVPHAR